MNSLNPNSKPIFGSKDQIGKVVIFLFFIAGSIMFLAAVVNAQTGEDLFSRKYWTKHKYQNHERRN